MATRRGDKARPTGGAVPGVLGYSVSTTRLRAGVGHGPDNRGQDCITGARNTNLRARAIAEIVGGDIGTLILGRRKQPHPNSTSARAA